MAVPTLVLRAATEGPALLVSAVFALLMLVLLPQPWDSVLLAGAATLLGLLARGRLEGLAVRWLASARAAGVAERHLLGPVLTRLAEVGVTVETLHVRRNQRAQCPAVVFLGRHTTAVVSPALLDAIYRNRVTVDETAALFVQARGIWASLGSRSALVILAATTPWRAAVSVCQGLVRAFGWMPALRMAWTLRGGIAVVCMVQSASEGRAAAGALGGLIIALTYLVPWAGRIQQDRLEVLGDTLVVQTGLGGALLQLLDRQNMAMTFERRARLAVSMQPQSQPVLHLIPGGA